MISKLKIKKPLKPRPIQKIKEMIPLEHEIQVAFIRWCELASKEFPALLLGFAVPNGGKRSAKTAAMMKMEGQRSGVPDYMLPMPCGGYTGLAIEFKRPKTGTVSEAQSAYINLLIKAGWKVIICTDWIVAMNTVKRYLKLGYSGRDSTVLTVNDDC